MTLEVWTTPILSGFCGWPWPCCGCAGVSGKSASTRSNVRHCQNTGVGSPFARRPGLWRQYLGSRLVNHLNRGEILQIQGAIDSHQIWREDVTSVEHDIGRRYNKWERIRVNGVGFVSAPGAVEPVFTNAQSPPVELRDGMLVRISYVENIPEQEHQRRIVRFEVTGEAASSCPARLDGVVSGGSLGRKLSILFRLNFSR